MAKTENQPVADSSQPQAGTVITPSSTAPPQPPAAAPAAPTPEPAVAPQPPEPVASGDTAAPADETPLAEPEVPPQNVESAEPSPSTDTGPGNITWTASEFIAHHKSAGWYGLLAITIAVLAAIVYALMKDPISTGVVVVVGFIFGIYAGRQPRQLEYALNGQGLRIGERHHDYNEFRWFSVIREGAFAGITFMPLQRFAVPITIYFPPENEDGILAVLANHLPMEEHRADALDKLLRRIRF